MNDANTPEKNSGQGIDPCLIEAITRMETYIEETTGQAPTHEELAQALSKYFVLKEIREFIEMMRGEQE